MSRVGPRAGSRWADALREGLVAFAVVGGVAALVSIGAWALARPPYELGVALRIGALYIGAFHHVPIRIEGTFDLGELTGGVLPGSDLPTAGSSFVEIGVALLAVTMLALWLLFRAGRRLGASSAGSAWAHLAAGASLAPAYAVPVFVVAVVVRIDEPVAIGTLVQGELGVSLSAWRALVYPLLVAGLAGAAGGGWAWIRERPGSRAGGALAGGWRALWLGIALSYGGLFVAGVIQPDEPVAVLTPSTANYFSTVFERPGVGATFLAHHLALAPNEGLWVLVPAAGGCDVVRGSAEVDFLCYGRFPRSIDQTVTVAEPALETTAEPNFGSAPIGYLLFLFVPAAATILGGREAARRGGVGGRPGAVLGALSGVVFGVLLASASVFAGVNVDYGGTLGERGTSGSLWLGPHPVTALLVGLAWGLVGGAIGGATSRWRLSQASRPGAGPRAPR